MANHSLRAKAPVEKLNRHIASASAVTAIFGGFRLLWASILFLVFGTPLSAIAVIEGVVFLGFGFLMRREQVWVFMAVLLLGALTFAYHVYLWIMPNMRGMSFLIVLSALMVISTYQALRAHWQLGKALQDRSFP